MGQYREDGSAVFPVVLSDGTGGNKHKLQQGKSQLGISRVFFSLQIVKHWNSLDRGCAISTLGNAQNSTSQGPEQPAPSWPCSKAGVWTWQPPELSSALYFSMTLGLLSPGAQVRVWAWPSIWWVGPVPRWHTCSSLAWHSRETSEINPVWEEQKAMKGLELPKDQLFFSSRTAENSTHSSMKRATSQKIFML